MWISPAMIGVPNQRTRYFLLARRNAVLPVELPAELAHVTILDPTRLAAAHAEDVAVTPPTGAVGATLQDRCTPLSDYLEPRDAEGLAELAVPEHILERYGSSMDLVSRSSRRSCCFTKNYSRYIKGAGSVVCEGNGGDGAGAGGQEGEGSVCSGEKSLGELRPLAPRFFAPREIARLHGFPDSFVFPASVGPKKQYELLGNSLSVQVVAALLRYLIGPHPPASQTE
jgi:tRNA (cytosine38-C5)-methyltransferase